MNKNIAIGAVIATVVVGGIGFYGGMHHQKSLLANARTQFARGGTGVPGAEVAGMGGGQRRGGQFGQGGAASGQIISRDANGFTVKLMDGSSRIVFTSASTKISKFVDGTPADLVADQYVFVTGSTNDDGSVTAESVQLRPNTPSPMPVPSK